MVLRHGERPRVLYIDAYDSFSNNIVGLLEAKLGAKVSVIRIDDDDARINFSSLIRAFDAVVAGPGPGHPANPDDVGLLGDLWKQPKGEIVPVLGVCLGFQSLGLAFGATTKRLSQPQHGIATAIVHCGDDIFTDTKSFQAVQYHSLSLDLGHQLEQSCSVGGSSYAANSTRCSQLRPLAWQSNGSEQERILMATRHVELPFWGVQFHPESISTDPTCHKLLDNWWKLVQRWHATSTRATSQLTRMDRPSPDLQTDPRRTPERLGLTDDSSGTPSCKLLWKKTSIGGLSVVKLAEQMKTTRSEVVMLDSQGHRDGRFSILGFIVPGRTLKVTYYGATQSLHREAARPGAPQVYTNVSQREVWNLLQSEADSHRPVDIYDDLPMDCPFWGGFMGYISYEAGLDSISVERLTSGDGVDRPDFNLALVERSVVIDHAAGAVYVQSLMQGDDRWVAKTVDLVTRVDTSKSAASDTIVDNTLRQPLEELFLLGQLKHTQIHAPSELTYRDAVLQCQEALHTGDSYELCLTGETQMLLPRTVESWSLYKRLRRQNAAPHGAFIRLSGATILGSSPERFLRWDRGGRCQFRPIKGTVKKDADMTYEKAKSILSTSKEKAENLMIVDLIRHDLSGVIGAGNVSVPQLMQVEEHATVYSLVSAIEGQLPRQRLQTFDESRPSREPLGQSGIDVLKASLPPGSMTGAPKKRSCEILAKLEQRPRGIYSGVLGYIDVGGGGDFSVVIRSAFHHERKSAELHPACPPAVDVQANDPEGSTSSSSSEFRSGGSTKSTPASLMDNDGGADQTAFDLWQVGAGGAITVLSTDKGEYEEMQTKLNSVLKTFQP